MRRLSTLIVTIAVAALAIPAVAGADTYCVNAGADCPPGGNEFGGVQPALDAAAATEVSDTLLLGDKGTPYFGPFVYQQVISRGGNRLTVRGVGGRPALTGPIGDTVLTAGGISLVGVDILAQFGEGRALDITDAALSEVNVIGPPTDAPDAHGIRAVGPVTIENTNVTGGFEEGLSVLGAFAGQEVSARRLRVDSVGVDGIALTTGAHLILSDSRVTAVSQAIASQGKAEVSRSVLATTGPNSVGVAEQGALAVAASLNHVTVAHRGAPSGADSAFLLQTDTPDAETRLQAVAIAGYTRGFRRITGASVFPHHVVVRDSVWDASRDELGGDAAGVFVESGNAHVAPALANLPGGDLRPAAGSAAIDRDSLTDPALFSDLEGVPALDGDLDGVVRPDAGAFEFRAAPPAPAPVPPVGETGGGSVSGSGSGPAPDLAPPLLARLGLTAGRTRVARAASVSLTRARRLRLLFVASEAAKVRIVPRRVVDGRLAKPRGAIVRGVAAGNGSIALANGLRRLRALRPGRLRLIVTATDAAGNRSRKRVLRLRLRA